MQTKTPTLCLIALLAAASLPAAASEPCRKSATRTAKLDVAGATQVVIKARAGDLQVKGESGVAQLSATGLACASTDKLLQSVQLEARREDNTLILKVLMPEDDDRSGNDYARLDLEVAVPDSLDVSIDDSSGDSRIRDLRSLTFTDSSGDLEISGIRGELKVSDSSGDIEIERISGNITLNDSSGDIEVEEVTGEVKVLVDSSGGIRIERAGSVHVLTDSSGDIAIEQVKGDVLIDNDSSGDITVADVGGKFTVLNDGSGSIRQQRVAGAVSLPER